MEMSELNAILENKSESSIIDSEIPSTSSDGQYICETCGKGFKTDLARRGHMQKHLGRYPKKESATQATKPIDILPENLAFLKNILKSFGAKGMQNILDGMQDNPTDLTELRDLLGANDNKANIPYILKRYSNFIGQPLPEEKTVKAESSFSDMFSLSKQAMELKMMQNLWGEKNNGQSSEVASLKADALSKQIIEMQKNFNEKLADMQKQYAEQLQKQKQEQELQLIKEQIKKTEDGYKSGLGSLGETFTEFMKEFQFREEKRELKDKYGEELQKLREQLQSQGGTLTERLLEKTDKAISSAGSGFLEMNKHMLKETASTERGDRAAALLQLGMHPEQVVRILENPQPYRQIIPPGSSEREYERLQKIVNQPTAQIQPSTQEPPQPEPKKPDEHIAEVETVKFNTSG